MKKLLCILGILAVLLLVSGPVAAWDESGIPTIPHAFYGTVTVNGVPAPAGAVVEARGDGVKVGILGNPITTAESGTYGHYDSMMPKLIVQGPIPPNTRLSFYVGGQRAGQSVMWAEGETTKLDLAVITFLPNGDGTFSYTGAEQLASQALAGLSFTSAYVLTPQFWVRVTTDTVLGTGAIVAFVT